jgi:hypothetical protein
MGFCQVLCVFGPEFLSIIESLVYLHLGFASLTGVLAGFFEQGFEDANELCAKHQMSVEHLAKVVEANDISVLEG